MNFRKGQINIGQKVKCLAVRGCVNQLDVGKTYTITGFNLSNSAWVDGNSGNNIDNLHGDWEIVTKE